MNKVLYEVRVGALPELRQNRREYNKRSLPLFTRLSTLYRTVTLARLLRATTTPVAVMQLSFLHHSFASRVIPVRHLR